MKTLRRLTVILALLCFIGTVTAQDVIVMKDQSTIMSKVLEITSTEIKYKKWNSQDGPTYSISLSDVLSINHQNGEMDTFSNINSQQNNTQPQIPTLDGGFMACTAAGLKLNGKALSDEEVRSLVGEQSYQVYLKGKRDNNLSGVCLCTSILAAIGAGVMYGLDKRGAGIALSVVDAVSWIGWLCIDGDDEMKQVAAEYNMRQGNYYSYNISPSLMKCEIPQFSSSYGLGLTININL